MQGSTGGDRAVYRAVEESLRQRLAQGAWPPGTMLPSRRDLARQYGVSSLTVERAIAPLVDEGLLRADGRRGTFVNDRSGETTHAPVCERRHASASYAPVRVAIITPRLITEGERLSGVCAEAPDGLDGSIVAAVEQALAAAGIFTEYLPFGLEMADEAGAVIQTGPAQAIEGAVGAAIVVATRLPAEVLRSSLHSGWLSTAPVVCVTSEPLGWPVAHVFSDRYAAGYQAAQHLIDGGVERLFLLAARCGTAEDDYIAGARAAAQHSDAAIQTEVMLGGDQLERSSDDEERTAGAQLARTLFGQQLGFVGVIGLSSPVAAGCVQAAQEVERMPGRDFLAVAVGDSSSARLLGITCLRIPSLGLAHEAARLAVQAASQGAHALRVTVRWDMILRRSSDRQRG